MADVRVSRFGLAVSLAASACGQADAPPGAEAKAGAATSGGTDLPVIHQPDENALRSGLAAPAGWVVAPSIATAAAAALNNPDAVEGAEAWAEPTMGCYAVWVAYRGDGAASAIAERVVTGLDAHGIRATEVILPTAGSAAATGLLTLAFDRPAAAPAAAPAPAPPPAAGSAAIVAGLPAAYAGRLRARLGRGRVEVLACFASERERSACDAVCSNLLGGFS